MRKVIETITNLLNGKEKNKLVEAAVFIAILGVIIIIASGSLFGSKKEEKKTPDAAETSTVETIAKPAANVENSELEKQVADILSQINGAGKVDVMITYISGKEVVPAFDEKKSENGTEERDTGGGTRNIRQNDQENKIAYEEQQGGVKKPIILKEKMPEVKGVVVVAGGASDAEVKEKLSKAVQVLLDVPIHRVQVFERDVK
ncbi:MAG: stage III sporulation protein AG [Clostridia bacterium]|nr:stage III sporulation protein AG [Clostridia bacterium]